MASTLLNECGKYRRDVIEAQLAHGKRNKVRGAYNHADLTQRWNESGWAVLHCRPQTILDESGKEIAKVKTPYTPNGYKDVPINSDLPGADGGGLMP